VERGERSRLAWQVGLPGVELPLVSISPVPGAGWLVGSGVLPAMSLPGVVREGQRAFWLLHFAWRCAIKFSSVKVRALCQQQKAGLVGGGVLLQPVICG
jgi:hypothetical protein